MAIIHAGYIKKFGLHFIKVLAFLYLVKIFLKTNLTDIGMAG